MAIEQSLNDQDKDNSQENQGVSTGGGASQSGSANTGGAPAAGARQPQGSGRFVNLQKYMNANQGAGQRLGQGINQQVNRGFEATNKNLATQQQGVNSGIQQGEGKLATGQGYGQSLGNVDSAAQLASDANKLQDFTKFRFGQGIDEQSLFDANRGYQQGIVSAQDAANKRLNQAGTEEGRYGLLQETFGGRGVAKPQYSTGQQRLDQLFLQSGAGDQIRNLQGNVQQNLQGLKGQAQTADQLNQNITGLATRESALKDMLNKGVNDLQTGYTGTLQDQMNATNAQRAAQQADYAKQFDILTGKAQGQLSDDFLKAMGLQKGQQVFNVLSDPNLTYQQALQNSANATNFNQTASADQLAKYNALNRLTQGALDAQGNYQYDPTQDIAANPLANAVTNTGVVGQNIQNAQKQYDALQGNAYNAAKQMSQFRDAQGHEYKGALADAIRNISQNNYTPAGMKNLIDAYNSSPDYIKNASGYANAIQPLIAEYQRLNPNATIPGLTNLPGVGTPQLSVGTAIDPVTGQPIAQQPSTGRNPFTGKIGI